jgi:hypothetical protein
VSLADALERAAAALPGLADEIRPANGDPQRLLGGLTAETAAEVLGWLLVSDVAAGEELALAWADDPRLEAAQAIGALDPDSLPKAAGKVLRKARHRLRSRGVDLAVEPPAPVVARLPRLEDELSAALISAPDPSGAQLAVLVEAAPSGGARVYQGAVDLERGILEFQVFETNRSQARRLVRELRETERLEALDVPREALAALLARAAEAQSGDRPLPSAFSEWRPRVARAPAGTATPGEVARAELPTEVEPTRLRQAAEWVAAGELGPWPPPLDELRALGEKVQRVAASRLVLDDRQRRSQVEGVIGDACEERYAGARGERTAARLEECAYARFRGGREEEARACLAAARAFRERSPRDNPVARALLGRALEPVLEVLREEASSSLVVKP